MTKSLLRHQTSPFNQPDSVVAAGSGRDSHCDTFNFAHHFDYIPDDVSDSFLRSWKTTMGMSKVLSFSVAGKTIAAASMINRAVSLGNDLGRKKHIYCQSSGRHRFLYQPMKVIAYARSKNMGILSAATELKNNARNLQDEIKALEQERDILRNQTAELDERIKHAGNIGLMEDALEKDQSLMGSLLTPESILSRAISHRQNQCGIYFLIKSAEIVYVGMSIDFKNRLKQHARDDEKVFDSYYFYPCNESSIEVIESVYIDLFNPRYNKKKGVNIDRFFDRLNSDHKSDRESA